MLLPSTCVSNDCGLFRLNTTRVRLPAWMTLRLRSAASSTWRCVAPSPLAVSRKSSAMRGGFWIAKLAGGFAGAFFNWKRTTTRPELARETVTPSRLLPDCAYARPANVHANNAASTTRQRRRVPIPVQ